jgi:hypothetical protein
MTAWIRQRPFVSAFLGVVLGAAVVLGGIHLYQHEIAHHQLIQWANIKIAQDTAKAPAKPTPPAAAPEGK